MAHYRAATQHEILMAQTEQLTVYVMEELPAPQVGDIRLLEYAGHVWENHAVQIVSGPTGNGWYEVKDHEDEEDDSELTESAPGWALTNAPDE